MSLKLNALPWLASVWQKARHWDTKEEPISAVIFSCSSDLCAVIATFKNTGKKQTLSQMYISLKETSQPPSPLLKETVNIDHVKCGAALQGCKGKWKKQTNHHHNNLNNSGTLGSVLVGLIGENGPGVGQLLIGLDYDRICVFSIFC